MCTLSVNVPAGSPTGKANPDTVLLGDNKTVTLSVTAGTPGTGGSWVWYASDKTTKVATNPFTPTTSATYYVRSENAACGVGAWSSAVQVTVNQPAGTPTGKATPASVCLGDNQTVTLSIASGDPGTGGSWVWYADDKVTKITTNPFTPKTEGISTFYVRSEGGAGGAGTWSAGIQLTVNQPADIPTGTANPTSVCLGSNQQVTLSATGTTGTGGTWVWYENDKTTKVTTNPFTPSVTKSYYVRSEGSACGNGPWSSAAVTVTVNQPASAPTSISASPLSICGSGTVTMRVVGGSLGTGGATWKWYKNATCTGTSFATGTEVTENVTATTTYGVRAEGGSCNISTNPATITINANVAPGTPSASASKTSYCQGETVELWVTGEPGTGGSWVWYKSDQKTIVPTNTFTAQSSETYYVRSEKGACGNGPFSDGVKVTVGTPSSNPISIEIDKVLPICPGSPIKLTVAGGNLGTNAKWVWYTNSSYAGTPVGSSTSTSLTVSPTSTTTYYVRAEGDCNKTTATVSRQIDVYSKNFTVSVSVSLEHKSVCSYPDVYFTAVASGSYGYTYEWQGTDENGEYKSMNFWATRSGPDGVNTEKMRIYPPQVPSSSLIRCVVKDGCGNTVNSDPVNYTRPPSENCE